MKLELPLPVGLAKPEKLLKQRLKVLTVDVVKRVFTVELEDAERDRLMALPAHAPEWRRRGGPEW